MNATRLGDIVTVGGRLLLSAAILLHLLFPLSVSALNAPGPEGETWINETSPRDITKGTGIDQLKLSPLAPAGEDDTSTVTPEHVRSAARPTPGHRGLPSLSLLLVASQATTADL